MEPQGRNISSVTDLESYLTFPVACRVPKSQSSGIAKIAGVGQRRDMETAQDHFGYSRELILKLMAKFGNHDPSYNTVFTVKPQLLAVSHFFMKEV